MNYHTLTNGVRIASFVNDSDRNYCMEVLEDEYPDCKMNAEDTELTKETEEDEDKS